MESNELKCITSEYYLEEVTWLTIIEKIYNLVGPLIKPEQYQNNYGNNFNIFLDILRDNGIAVENIAFARGWKETEDFSHSRFNNIISRDSFGFTVPLYAAEDIVKKLKQHSIIFFMTYVGNQSIDWSRYEDSVYESKTQDSKITRMFLGGDANIFSIGVPSIVGDMPLRKIILYRGPSVIIQIESNVNADIDEVSEFISVDLSPESLIPNYCIHFIIGNRGKNKKIMEDLNNNTVRFDLINAHWPQYSGMPESLDDMNVFRAMIDVIDNISEKYDFSLTEEAQEEWRKIEELEIKFGKYTVDEMNRMI